MRLYRLGEIPWQETQGIYHALAESSQEALVLCRPKERYVCLGFHDDLNQEIDIDYCQQQSIPLIRRETGGGVVLLDKDQLFFQLVLHKDNPLLSVRRDKFFAVFLQPAVDTLTDYGLKAAVQSPADIVIEGRKISGNGAGDINGYAVYIGNILLDFDRGTMANVLKAPNEVFRHYTKISMERHLITLREALGEIPAVKELEEKLIYHFTKLLPKLNAVEYTSELRKSVLAAADRLVSSEILSLPGRLYKARQIKIKEGVYLRLHCRRKPSGDSDTAILLTDNNIIQWVELYSAEPFEQGQLKLLESALSGRQLNRDKIEATILEWQKSYGAGRDMLLAARLATWICEGSN